MKKKSTRRTIMLAIANAEDVGKRRCLVAADAYSQALLRKRNYGLGELVSAEIRTPRNPAFFRKAHALATSVIENVDDFSHFTAHQHEHDVLKRIQLESGVACNSITLRGDFGLVEHRIPQSMSFENMTEEEFAAVYSGLLGHIRRKYWPTMTQDEIEAVAEFSGNQG